MKTFGLQVCTVDGTGCTSEFGNFPNSPAGTEKIHSQQLPFTAGHPLPDTAGNTNFGTATDKLVTITTRTSADRVYVYNPNVADTAHAYPKLLPSTSTSTSPVADVLDLSADRLDPDRTPRLIARTTPTAASSRDR